MIALIIFLVIAVIVIISLKKNAAGNERLIRSLNIFRNIAFIAIGVAVILSAVVQVGPGEAGVQVLFGSVQEGVLHSGLNIVAHDEGQMKGDDAITALSEDGLTIKLDVTVWYRLSEPESPQVYRTIGVDYIDKIVRPAIRTALRDVAVMFSATDIYSNKREDYVRNVTKNLEDAFNGRGVVLERVLLRTVELPETVRQAIDEKIAAEQKAQQMVYVLQKERQEAERKKVEAQGISDFNRIVSQSITEQTLQMKGIEATLELAKSQNSKLVIMNGKNMPLIYGIPGQ
jgi:regulator of protease activity HflC (stomatin/prohibitin superfamily)